MLPSALLTNETAILLSSKKFDIAYQSYGASFSFLFLSSTRSFFFPFFIFNKIKFHSSINESLYSSPQCVSQQASTKDYLTACAHLQALFS
jgi:hypothetical protein